jgi:hypothetical protein
MRIRSAVEVMKMLGPLAPEFTQEKSTFKIMKAIIDRINEEHPPAAIRLLALMEGKSAEEVTEELAVNMDAKELYTRLVAGLNNNDLILMMDFASVIGLSDARWAYE